jgi:hypothetical protein
MASAIVCGRSERIQATPATVRSRRALRECVLRDRDGPPDERSRGIWGAGAPTWCVFVTISTRSGYRYRVALAQRVGRHRVLVPVVPDSTAGRHEDGNLQRVLCDRDRQRRQPGALFGEARDRSRPSPDWAPACSRWSATARAGLRDRRGHRSDDSGRSCLDPADEILDGALLLSRTRPAQLRSGSRARPGQRLRSGRSGRPRG